VNPLFYEAESGDKKNATFRRVGDYAKSYWRYQAKHLIFLLMLVDETALTQFKPKRKPAHQPVF
jgi:hypothetical protein